MKSEEGKGRGREQTLTSNIKILTFSFAYLFFFKRDISLRRVQPLSRFLLPTFLFQNKSRLKDTITGAGDIAVTEFEGGGADLFGEKFGKIAFVLKAHGVSDLLY